MPNNYKVGYRKPPKATQFKPGQSGNPRGRPRREQSLRQKLLQKLGATVTARDTGEQVPLEDALINELIKKAHHGTFRDILSLFQLLLLLDRDSDEPAESDNAEDDEAILAAYRHRILAQSSRDEEASND